MIDTGFALVTCIVSLWCKHKFLRILRIPEKTSDALQHIPVIELQALLSNYEFLALKSGAPGQLVIDEFIQLFNCVIRKPERIGNLES